MTIQVEGLSLPFLVDTGATFSMITAETALKLPNLAFSSKTQTTYGLSGIPLVDKLTMPLRVANKLKQVTHSFLVSETCPVNLLARDLLSKLEFIIFISNDGMEVFNSGGAFMQITPNWYL